MPPLSPSATRALLDSLGHRPRHSLGQSFLIDGNIVRKSLELAEIREGDAVVEIGPGLGTLTGALLDSGAEVWAVEKDPRLYAHLAATLSPAHPEALHLMEGDAMDHPIAGVSRMPFKIVANLPYAISTPWLDAVLAGPLPERMTLMLQREAALRYTAQPGSKAFGAISIFLQAAYDTAPGHRVSASCFFPAPEIESCLLNLARKSPPVIFGPPEKMLIRSCFQQRRRQIGSLLRARRGGDAAALLVRLAEAGVTEKTRPEEIPTAAWIRCLKDGGGLL